MAKVRFTLALSDKEAEMLKEISEKTPLMKLGVDRTTMIRYIILSYGEMQNKLEEAQKRADDTVQAALSGARAGGKVKEAPLSYSEKKKLREEEERAAAINICEQLEGTVEGEICYFKKYEITPVGYVVSNRISENIYNLSEKTVKDQYYPDRETWEKAKAEEDAKEGK